METTIIPLAHKNDEHGSLAEMAKSRARGAIQEYRKRTGSRILVQGGFGHFNSSPKPFAEHLARFLVEQSVNPNDIDIVPETTTTVEEAASAQRFLANSGPRCVCIVTSEIHMKRTALIFRHFFDDESLVFVSTPDCVSDEELAWYRDHEERGLRLLGEQGGVMVNGTLIRKGLADG